MILGDLFDTHDINPVDFLATYQALVNWLDGGGHLYLACGNHDLSKTSTTLSSFELLGALLEPYRTTFIKEPTMMGYGYVIPHLPNQTLFDEALARVPECNVLYLHVNYDNHFAANSDQSLNISKEQAEACKARSIVIAHEHNMKRAGKVTLPGNQIASSVSDWINSPIKYYTTVDEGNVRLHMVRTQADEFQAFNWKHLEPSSAKFIRIEGSATVEEASLAVTAVAKYRALSPALVVTSAIQVHREDDTSALAESLESAQAFDVWAALQSHLTAEQFTKIKALT